MLSQVSLKNLERYIYRRQEVGGGGERAQDPVPLKYALLSKLVVEVVGIVTVITQRSLL